MIQILTNQDLDYETMEFTNNQSYFVIWLQIKCVGYKKLIWFEFVWLKIAAEFPNIFLIFFLQEEELRQRSNRQKV